MSDRPLEYAMTHRIGAGGSAERCQRPEAVRAIATRLQKWAAAPESCQGCHAGSALRFAGGLALCGTCHTQRFQRLLMPLETQGRTARAEAPDDEVDGLQLRGLAIVFNAPSGDLGFTEYIRPAAADRNDAEGIDVRALWSHNPDFTIGRMSAGTLRTKKTARGVAVEIDPPRWAAPYVETVKRRDVSGMSFAFEAIEDEWWIENARPARAILDMRYYEVSGVSFPAYPSTTLRVAKADERSAWLREQETGERLRMVR